MPTPTMLSLGAALAREQDRVLGGQRIHEIDLLEARRRSRRRKVSHKQGLAIVLVGLLVVVVAALATISFRFPTVRYSVGGPWVASNEPSNLGHWITASAEEPIELRFTDGSRALLAKGCRTRVVGTNRRGASLVVESGTLEVEVAGSDLTEYLVGTGPFALALARGRVEISWNSMSDSLDLVANHGNVVISGCQFGSGARVASTLLGVRCSAK